MSLYSSDIEISGNGLGHTVSESATVLDNSVTISGKGLVVGDEESLTELDIQQILTSRHLELSNSEVTATYDCSLALGGHLLNLTAQLGTIVIDANQSLGGAGSHTGIATYWGSDYDETNKKVTLNAPIGSAQSITARVVSLDGHKHDGRYYIEDGVIHLGEDTFTAALTQLNDVTISNPTDGQVLKYNGSRWVNGEDGGGGGSTGESLWETDTSDIIKPKNGKNAKTPNYLIIGDFKLEDVTETVSSQSVRSLRITRLTSGESANIYTTGGIAAYGASSGGGSGRATNLYQLSDVPDYRSDYRGKLLKSKSDGSGMEWIDVPTSAVWGNITGELSSQTDLANALAGKAASSHTHAISDITNLQTSLDAKVTANTAITAATKCKITYDSKGLVTAGEDLSESDIPTLSASKITGLSAFMTAFNEMFTLEGSGTSASPYVIKAKHDLYSIGGISAYGEGSGGGGGQGNYTYWMTDPTASGATQATLRAVLTGGTATKDGVVSLVGHTHTKSQISDFPTNVSTFTNDAGYLTGITSSQVTNALGYTPQNASTAITTSNISSQSVANAGHIYSKSYTSAGNTIAEHKAGLATAIASQNHGIGDNIIISTSVISQWDNDSATVYDTSNHSMIKIGGGYSGSKFGQWLLSSYNLTRLGVVGRDYNAWSSIKWLAWTDDIPTDNNQLTNGAGYIASSGGTMTGILNVATGYGLQDASGNGLIVYHPTSWNGISNIQWGCGAIDCQGVIRSNASNLIHYKGGTNYTIYDSGNCNNTSTAWNCSSLAMNGALSGATTITSSGKHTVTLASGTDGEFTAVRGDYSIYFGIGVGNVNRGIYDNTNNSWMIYRDATTNVLIPQGNVGIGTTSPSYKLDVSGTIRATGAALLGGTLTVTGGTTLNGGLTVNGNGYVSGNLGVGITAEQKLDVVGKLRLRCSSDSTKYVDLEIDSSGNLKINGNIYATGGVTAYQSA